MGAAWGAIVVAACAAAVVGPTTAGCGGGSRACTGGDSGDAESSNGDGQGGQGAPMGMGQVFVEASVTNCASLTPISVSPNNGGSVQLGASIVDAPDNGAPPTVKWTATSGTFTDPLSSNTTFLCAAPGTVTVTLTLSSPGCDQHASASVTCT
jgi:hypothetical protein